MRQEKLTFIELRIYRIICFALNCSFQARATLIRALHTEYGSKLVDSLVRAAVLTLPSYTYHDIGDVLHECLQHDRASVCSWLEQCLKTLQSSESNSINSITQTQVARKFSLLIWNVHFLHGKLIILCAARGFSPSSHQSRVGS